MFRRFMFSLQRFFYGRNGADQLSFVILLAVLALNFIFTATGLRLIGSIITLVGMAYVMFRMLSKNIGKRRAENAKWLNLWQKIKRIFSKNNYTARDKDHKVFTCHKCKQKLRVPKGKGKINITCTSCGNKFIKKT